MKITWFGQSAFRIETGRSVLIIDPFLSGSPVFKGDSADAMRGATHVALTHGHDDHVGDTVAICKANGATLIAVFEICAHLGKKGVEKTSDQHGRIYLYGGFRHHLRAGLSLLIIGGRVPWQSVGPRHQMQAGKTHDLPYGRHGNLRRYGSHP